MTRQSIFTRAASWLRTNVAAVDLKSFFAAQLGSGGVPDSLTGAEDAFHRLGIVYRCLRVIVGTASVGIDTVNAKGEPIVQPETRKWLDQPYPGMDNAQWVKRIIGQMVITGGSRLLMVEAADPKGWMPTSLTECSVDGDVNEFPPKQFRYGGKVYPPERVVSIQGPDPTQINDAFSAVEAASLSSDTGYYARKHAAGTIKDGAFIGAILKYAKNFPDKKTKEEFLNGWTDAFNRARKRGGFPLLEAGGDFEIEKLGLSFADLALTEMIASSDREIARAMGVPPAYLGEDSNSLANFAEQRKIFLETTLEDTWRTIESALNLGADKLGFKGTRFRFRRDECPIAQEVKSTRGIILLPAVGKCVTRNEWREAMGMDALPPDVGDVMDMAIMSDYRPAKNALPPPPEEPERAISDGLRAFLTPPVKREEPRHNGRTPNERAIFARAFVKELTANERAYARTFTKIFNSVKVELRASAESWEVEHKLTYDRDKLRDLMNAKRKAILPAVWNAGKSSGEGEIAAVAGGRTFKRIAGSLTPKVMAEIAGRATNWTELTEDETFRAVAELMERGVQEGYSLQQMMTALEDFAALSPARAERIARTEVLSSLNAGRLDAYGESGVCSGKEWLATEDDRTRDAHYNADGQTVGLGASFVVGGEELDYPGDPQGEPGNIINCRCSVLPVVDMEE